VTPPPELHELPAWYTDPLPNAPRPPGSGGPPAPRDDVPPAPGAGPAGPGTNGNGTRSGPPGPSDGPGRFPTPHNGANGSAGSSSGALAPWDGAPGNGHSPSGIERLPGAGDELRSLFGEVVRDPADEPPPAARPAPPTQVRPLPDPLGPFDARPPIDLSALDTPLGPAPFLGNPDAGTGAPAAKAPPRLPSRHEVVARPPAGGTGAPTVKRLPRAGEMAAPSGPSTAGAATAPARPGVAASGPPALPLIILIAVVAVLIAGVAWLVLTGDDAAPPASERDPAADTAEGADDGATAGDNGASTGAPTAPGGTGAAGTGGTASGAPTGVQAAAGADGVQVTWQGAGDAFTVTVLTPDQAPTPIAATGTSVLVPTASLGTSGSWCVTVAATPAGGQAGPASAPVCSDGATVDTMRGA
jgi:hypothetical protein